LHAFTFPTELHIVREDEIDMLKGGDGNITENARWPRVTMCTQVAYELRVSRSSGYDLDPAGPRWNTRNTTLPNTNSSRWALNTRETENVVCAILRVK